MAFPFTGLIFSIQLSGEGVWGAEQEQGGEEAYPIFFFFFFTWQMLVFHARRQLHTSFFFFFPRYTGETKLRCKTLPLMKCGKSPGWLLVTAAIHQTKQHLTFGLGGSQVSL